MIQLASVEAERALWASHNSVSRYVIRLYNHLKPKVVAELSQSISKIYISFDRWTTKGGKRGYLGIVAHYVNSKGDLVDLPIALPQLTGAHSGEAIAKVVIAIFKEFNINVYVGSADASAARTPNTKTPDSRQTSTRCNSTTMAPIDDAIADIESREQGENFTY